MVEKDGIVFLSYGGFFNQSLISGMTEALEKEAENNELNMGIANNIYTVFIELSQNMMNYSKILANDATLPQLEGLIVVSKGEEFYSIHAQNIVITADKEKIEPKLQEISSLDRDGIKKRYRELRRSGKDTHHKGAGIGFYEIAKRSACIDYEFKKIDDEKYFFHVISKIKAKKEQ